MRGCRTATLAFLTAFGVAPAASAAELRTISRNALVFVDSVTRGGEWAAYRVADELRPVIFRADGPSRVVLRLRTTVAKDSKTAVAAILRDDRIVLTARIDPERDPDAELVEGGGKATSKPRIYVLRLDPGEHTVTVRYSEGGAIYVAGRLLEGEAPEGELADPARGAADRVQHIATVPLEPGGEEGARAEASEVAADAVEAVEAARESGDARRVAEDEAERGEKPALADPEVWKTDKGEGDRPEKADRSPTGPSYEPLPPEAFVRRPFEPAVKRRLTVPAPWLTAEVRGGATLSRLGLDPAPVVGADVHVPIPGLDARVFSIGLALDAAHARGDARVVTALERSVVDVATMRHTFLLASADVRWSFLPVEDLLDPWLALGAGVLVGALEEQSSAGARESGTFGVLGLARLGAAFGHLGSRPFFELGLGLGRLDSDLARSTTSEPGGTGYLEVDVVVGWRFELVTEAPAE